MGSLISDFLFVIYLFRESIFLARDIARVERLVRDVATRFFEVFVIQNLHYRIVVRLSETVFLIFLIQHSRTRLGDVDEIAGRGIDYRLTAAVDATTRTRHYLDEVILALARFDVFHYLARIGKSARDGDINFFAVERDRRFLDTFRAAYRLKIDIFEFVARHDFGDRSEERRVGKECL